MIDILFTNSLTRSQNIENYLFILAVFGGIYLIILNKATKNAESISLAAPYSLKEAFYTLVYIIVGMLLVYVIVSFVESEYDNPKVFNVILIINLAVLIVCLYRTIINKAFHLITLYLPVIITLVALLSFKFGTNIDIKKNTQTAFPPKGAVLYIDKSEFAFLDICAKRYTKIYYSENPNFKAKEVHEDFYFKVVAKNNIWGKVASFIGITDRVAKGTNCTIYIDKEHLGNTQEDIDKGLRLLKNEDNVIFLK
jgi:hypothetical protein